MNDVNMLRDFCFVSNGDRIVLCCFAAWMNLIVVVVLNSILSLTTATDFPKIQLSFEMLVIHPFWAWAPNAYVFPHLVSMPLRVPELSPIDLWANQELEVTLLFRLNCRLNSLTPLAKKWLQMTVYYESFMLVSIADSFPSFRVVIIGHMQWID